MRKVLAALFLLLSTASHALTVTDDLGQRVDIARAPQRIVSLLPSLTEFTCVLGACDRLVGVDDFSNHPASVRALPHVGGLEDARVESIVGLRPDLVLVPTSSRALERLQALGLKVLALEPRTFADVQRVLALLGPVLAARDGAQVWREIERGVAQAAAELPAAQRGARVYFEVSSAPYAASEASFIGELLTRIGARNIVPAALGPFPKLNPEFVVRADPDVIMLTEDDGPARLATRPGWQHMRALRAGRTCEFTRAEGDVLVRAGPRMAEGARLMVQCLRGTLRTGNGRP
ncbi:ABC transporter substrate-binding protein [Ramlibacter sp. USB13]|uniref:ABC transporter substrate-binding protein n=1 Tax=Ramlibacter cellulosilyticus TaxID=2764187 RepID=A0A923MSW9_9BURK|nr:helical backbone metal receptor [Ramlibacter cellulosilyticus]MBC5783217.1 ABC transporter substrate-binding protein [Ramlibacter cellulosilyticus]